MTTATPARRPANPCFSSGPCAKRPGWSLEALRDAALGRSHRAKIGKTKLQSAIELTREVLEIPADYRIGIVPGSDTGAVEMAMWTMLGARPVDVLAWESFGEGWVTDAVKQLKLTDTRTLKAPYGGIVDFKDVDFDHDVVFTWNGTTSGVRVAAGTEIPADRAGLTMCDATSAAFAQELPWDRLDVVTFSWQKALGGEAAHGMLVLSPRAVERLLTYTPPRPLPKVFRLVSGGKLAEGLFKGETINTPSMLCVEDYLDALNWGKDLGGLKGLVGRADRNAAALDAWVRRTPWVANLAERPEIQSNTSVCLKVVDPVVTAQSSEAQAKFAKDLATLLEKEGCRARHRLLSRRTARPSYLVWRHGRDRRRRSPHGVARLGLRQGLGRVPESGLTL